MNFSQFVQRVQERSSAPSREASTTAAISVLTTLSERISRGQRLNLSAQLPNELKPPFMTDDRQEGFGVEEFVRRVQGRCGVEHDEAAALSRAVLGTLNEAIAPGEIDDVASELPKEFDSLLSGNA
ncbi:DUF2267 domain-containing protein [Desulfocurvibacter africanus]|uniref:DUF2267 domain-containing protein n=2 Tax=Desulfocurvibacter africanus TaxID=873 RepID=F3Z1I2_DESAF|nr:DUF2267 domain-containing protein [Desulfocurvibacter africanus]EGJ50013.1 Protein of unknown function DUF2267 [Desulfocurvibacter africanus subsp. africanus str. Walvis Bay]EMG36150.1 hypothetical protein PCS_03092 [Desulfocurvibacter africanus PCS]